MAHHALALAAQGALVLLARAGEARPVPALAGRPAEERRDLVDALVAGPKAPADIRNFKTVQIQNET